MGFDRWFVAQSAVWSSRPFGLEEEPLSISVLTIKFRLAGRGGTGQKNALIKKSLESGQLVDYHPYIVDAQYVESRGGRAETPNQSP